MSINAIKYETGAEINWDGLDKCWEHDHGREDTAYQLYKNKKDLTDSDRRRLFELLDARACYNYAMEVVKGRWKEAEGKIATGGYYYDTWRDKWGRGSDKTYVSLIQNGTKWAYLYALNVVGGRWEDGEERIKEEMFASLAYAKNVLKGRFALAEPDIMSEKSVLTFKEYRAGCWITDRNPKIPSKFSEYERLFFLNTHEPGDSCDGCLQDWMCYDGCEIRDVYVAELFGGKSEDFEKRVMKSKKYDDKMRCRLLSRYSVGTGRLSDKAHNFMLGMGLEKDENALKYCEMFADDFLKAKTLGFAPR